MIALSREELAKRVAAEIPVVSFVNLGIGLPTLIADLVPADRNVFLHRENGILRVVPKPEP